ncbi:smad nuclear interacting protein 1, partial [Chiua virens]
MSAYSRDYGKDSSRKRNYDDNDHPRRRGEDGVRHEYHERRHGSGQRRDEERRRDRRDYPDDRRSYGRDRDYDGRGSRRDREIESDRDRDKGDRHSDRRQRESSRERTRRSASPSRRSRTRSKSPVDKAKPNFNPSGLLAAATNTVKATDGTSTVLKYNEPPEARKPTLGWRLYVFKGSEQTELLHIHRQSAYLIGRDRTVADIFIEHPSCSKQHAVIQHRQVQEKDEFGGSKAQGHSVIDLESTNATHVNDEVIPTSRYYELRAGDVVKFGLSNREYVLLHDDSA